MSCIWSGHIQEILHAIQLRSIVDQLMFWALRHSKPWVTGCLRDWNEEESNEEDTNEEVANEEVANEEGANKYEFIYRFESNRLMVEMLISTIRKDKSTQTLGDEHSSPNSWGRSQSIEHRSERHIFSDSDTTESDQTGPWESESLPRSQSQAASNRSSLSHSSRLSEVDSESSHVLTMPVQEQTDSAPASNRTISSPSKSENIPKSQSQAASNRSSLSHSSGPSEVDPELSHVPTMPDQETTDQSTSEDEVRLREIRARVRKACINSLILTNRVHSLAQKITLAQMRSQGS